MTCERARELMIDALVQPLSDDELQELRAHLDACDTCTEAAVKVERLWSSLETVAIPVPEPDGEARLMQAVKEEFDTDTKDSVTARQPSTILAGWRAAAALALVAMGSLLTIAIQDWLERGGETAGDGKARYMLIMTEIDETPGPVDQAQEEFSAWINDLVEREIMETGYGIADLPPVGAPPDGNLLHLKVSGVIVIRAEDAEEAREIAASSPIHAYGGTIEIRELAGNDSED